MTVKGIFRQLLHWEMFETTALKTYIQERKGERLLFIHVWGQRIWHECSKPRSCEALAYDSKVAR